MVIVTDDESQGLWHIKTKDFVMEPKPEKHIQSFEEGLINIQGDVIVDIKYDSIGIFNEGLAMVSDNGKFGFIDKEGNEIVEPQYTSVDDFKGGKAPVEKLIDEERAYGVIDKEGNWVIEPGTLEKEYSLSNLTENLLKLTKTETIKEENGQSVRETKHGIMDLSGEILNEPELDYIYSFNQGLARFVKDDKSGYIDEKGEKVIEPKFDGVSNFNESGLATVEKDNKSGLIDKAGEFVVEARYDNIRTPHMTEEIFFVVEREDDK